MGRRLFHVQTPKGAENHASILVKDLSRFGRNYIEFGQYTDYLFPSIGCRFIALNNCVDTAKQDGNVDSMCFLNLFNEFYSRDTSKKVRSVKKACAESGKFMGTYPAFGYKRDPEDKHHLVIDEETAPIVRRIFAMRASGMGYRAIALALNQEGIPSPRLSLPPIPTGRISTITSSSIPPPWTAPGSSGISIYPGWPCNGSVTGCVWSMGFLS